MPTAVKALVMLLTAFNSIGGPQSSAGFDPDIAMKQPKVEKILNVVLDIDECLVHSTFLGDVEYRQYEADREKKNADGLLQVDTISVACEDGAPVSVALRPHLLDFLRELEQRYNVYAFTAALPIYARPLLNALEIQVMGKDKGRLWQNAWYREHCTPVSLQGGKYEVYTKDILNTCEMDPSRSVLIDNSMYSFIACPDNGIPVPNFIDDPHDMVLKSRLEFLAQLDDHVSNGGDVRDLLRPAFDLRRKVSTIS